jgi:hypothetical protein
MFRGNEAHQRFAIPPSLRRKAKSYAASEMVQIATN